MHKSIPASYLFLRLLLLGGLIQCGSLSRPSVESAIWAGKTKTIEKLLNNEKIQSETLDSALIYAITNGKPDIVKLLLKSGRVDPSAQDNEAIIRASEHGYLDIVKALLKDERVNPAARMNEAIRSSSIFGNADVVKVLLKDKRVDPTVANNWPLIFSSAKGHAEVLEVLLKDGRADPAARSNKPLFDAVQAMDADILKLLLEDGRADPTFNNNEIFNQVKKYGESPFKLLLEKDPRVKSIDFLNTATAPLTGNAFLDLFKSGVQLNTPSYIENIFANRDNHLVASFLAGFFKIPLEEANKIHNLDDLDKYMNELYQSVYQLPQEYIEFLWRYYSIRPDQENRFQELTAYLVKNGFVFQKDVLRT